MDDQPQGNKYSPEDGITETSRPKADECKKVNENGHDLRDRVQLDRQANAVELHREIFKEKGGGIQQSHMRTGRIGIATCS